tara:strand:+ start:183 stop:557 length:375 start_codon:yes stop_codon:yes gene_type:complete
MKWVLKTLTDVIKFDGRSHINESRYFFIFNFIILLFALIVDITFDLKHEIIPGLSTYLITETMRIILFFPNLSLGIRRLHDTNKSGWWILLSFTIVGIIPLFYWFYFVEGEDKENQYGKRPEIL